MSNKEILLYSELVDLYVVERNLKHSTEYVLRKIVCSFFFENNIAYLSDVDKNLVLKWRHRKLKSIKNTTLNSYIGYLNAVFEYGIKNCYINHKVSPFEGLTVRTAMGCDKRLMPEVIDKIFNYLDGNEIVFGRDPSLFWKTVFMVLYHTGMRISQLIGIRPEDVDLKYGWILMRADYSKNYMEYKVPMNDELNKIVKEFKNKCLYKRGQFFNIHENRLKIKHHKMLMDTQDVFYVCSRLSSIIDKKVTTHMFRHTLASDIIRETGNLIHAQKVLGHIRIESTSRYVHVDNSELKVTLNNINRQR